MPNPDGSFTPDELARMSVSAGPAPEPAPGPWTLPPEVAPLANVGVPPVPYAAPQGVLAPLPAVLPPVAPVGQDVQAFPGDDGSAVAPQPQNLSAPGGVSATPSLTVPGSDRWGIAPQKQAPGGSGMLAPPPGLGMFDYTTKNVGDIQRATTDLAAKEAAKAKFAGEELNRQAIDRNHQEDLRQQALGEVTAEGDRLRKDILDSKIDPHRLWNSKGGGEQAMSLVGILLSGIGSGLTKQPNLALEVINKAIERDINAQTADLGKKENALASLHQKYGNLQMAQQALRISQGEVYKMKLDAGLAQLGEGAEKAKGALMAAQAGTALAQMKDQFAQQLGMMRYQLSMVQSMTGGGGQGYSYGAGNSPVPKKWGPEGSMEAAREAQGQTFHLPNGEKALASSPKAAEDAKPIMRAAGAFQEVLGRLRSGSLGPVEVARETDAARAELAILIGNGQATGETQEQAKNIVGGWGARVTPGVDPYSAAERLAHDRVAATVRAATGDKYTGIREKGK